MKVFIGNFGRANSLWPDCLQRHSIATYNDEDVHSFWVSGDREAYVDYCVENKKTAANIRPPRATASRWFSLMDIITSTSGDIWIHREKDRLWWTTSKPEAAIITLEPLGLGCANVYIARKPCEKWSNQTLTGASLLWNALHPRARQFLFSETTFQEISEANAQYALNLIAGKDLRAWHDKAEWKAKSESLKKAPALSFNARQKSIYRMVATAKGTAATARGQEVTHATKVKYLLMSDAELTAHTEELLDAQEGLCAISGLELQYEDCEDVQLRCSLDRIDSSKHYEQGNLQIVCWFVNRWKKDDNDAEFRRLVQLLRTVT